VNGRVLGDKLGFYTCFNHKDAPSVIDYMICSQPLMNQLSSFHVNDPSTFSIHCSLSTILKTNPFKKSAAAIAADLFTAPNQYKWREGDNDKFCDALLCNTNKKTISNFNQANFGENIDEAVASLNNI
jgi:hypothetical protein